MVWILLGISYGGRMEAARLKQYAGMARLFYRSGNRQLVTQAGLEEALKDTPDDPAESDATESDGRSLAKRLAGDLEQLGPAYIKLGQLLSTRSDLLPPAYPRCPVTPAGSRRAVFVQRRRAHRPAGAGRATLEGLPAVRQCAGRGRIARAGASRHASGRP